jgi:hypothetical protein
MHFSRTKIYIITIIVASLLIVVPVQMAKAQTLTTVSVTPQNNTVAVGQTFKVDIDISNVQNLYGIDITVNWNSSILQFVSANLHLGDQASGGVLHGDPVSTTAQDGGVFIQDNSAQSGEYHLAATSENSAQNPVGPFSGSGSAVTLTFTVVSAGHSSLTLNPELASYVQPGSGEASEPISANIVNGTVVATSSSSSPSASPTSSSSSSPTSSSSSSSSSSSPVSSSPSLFQPANFPVLLAVIVVVVVVLVAIGVVLSRRMARKTTAS